MTYRYNRTEAVQRTYAPQGLIGLLLADLQDKEKHFVEVDLDHPFFRVFAVNVAAPIDFQRIGLLSAQVAIDYGNPNDAANHKHADFVFEPGSQTERKFEVFMNQQFETAYTYSVQYHFDPGSDWDGHAFAYELPAKRTEDRTLQIQPFADLGFLEVRVFSNRIDWGVIDSIDGHLHYQSPTGWKRDKAMTFTADTPAQFWKLRLDHPNERTYSYHCVYHLKDGSRQESETILSQATALPINDLFEGALDLQFIPLFNADQVRMVFIDVKYDDPVNRYHRDERLELVGTATAPVSLRIALKDRTKRSFQYRFTFIGTDNRLNRGSFVTTQESLIGVSDAS
ncbi:MAG: hypothetical protein HC827_07250 [Cyanobacteria bacterium RM1_2_2]|nr:hypothetical protein [Cyanobacteria bacterium RM1_2_2]